MNSNMKKILILSIPGIGNTIMITPMLEFIHKNIENADIIVLVTLTGSKEVLEKHPFVREVISVDGRMFHKFLDKLRILLMLRSLKFDICITAFPANDIRYNILAWLTGAKHRIGHSYPTKRLRTLSFLQNTKIPMSLSRHDVLQNLDLLKPLGVSVESNDGIKIKVWRCSGDAHKAKQFLNERGIRPAEMLIGIHPGSSENRKMIYKRWPKEKFAALGDMILEECPGARVLLFGGPEEDELKREVATMMNGRPVIVSELSIREVSSVIEQCALLICNDSGLMHVACAMKVPVVAIFGPTDPAATVPYGTRYVVATQNMVCHPCWSIETYGTRSSCRQDTPYQCLVDLSVESVFEAMERLLQGESKELDYAEKDSYERIGN